MERVGEIERDEWREWERQREMNGERVRDERDEWREWER